MSPRRVCTAAALLLGAAATAGPFYRIVPVAVEGEPVPGLDGWSYAEASLWTSGGRGPVVLDARLTNALGEERRALLALEAEGARVLFEYPSADASTISVATDGTAFIYARGDGPSNPPRFWIAGETLAEFTGPARPFPGGRSHPYSAHPGGRVSFRATLPDGEPWVADAIGAAARVLPNDAEIPALPGTRVESLETAYLPLRGGRMLLPVFLPDTGGLAILDVSGETPEVLIRSGQTLADGRIVEEIGTPASPALEADSFARFMISGKAREPGSDELLTGWFVGGPGGLAFTPTTLVKPLLPPGGPALLADLSEDNLYRIDGDRVIPLSGPDAGPLCAAGIAGHTPYGATFASHGGVVLRQPSAGGDLWHAVDASTGSVRIAARQGERVRLPDGSVLEVADDSVWDVRASAEHPRFGVFDGGRIPLRGLKHHPGGASARAVLLAIPRASPCFADHDWNGVVDVNDLLAFLGDFRAGSPDADIVPNCTADVADLLAFLGHFRAGCDGGGLW